MHFTLKYAKLYMQTFYKVIIKILRNVKYYKFKSAILLHVHENMPMWRNGRRDGLKIRWGQLHVGSTPTIGTIIYIIKIKWESNPQVRKGALKIARFLGQGSRHRHFGTNDEQCF